jgi:hypothetical protein
MKSLNETQTGILKDYIKLKLAAKSLESDMDKIKPLVKDILISVNAEDTPVETVDGKLYLRPRRKWTYSPELEARMAEVKAAQKYEEATGKANPETAFDIYFKGSN